MTGRLPWFGRSGGGRRRDEVARIGSGLAPEPAPGPGAVEAELAAHRIRSVASALYALLAGEAGNLLLSPYSVAAALGMLARGSAGATHQEFFRLVHDEDDLGPRWYRSIAAHLTHPGAVLEPAIGMFAQHGSRWLPAFTADLVEHYGAPLREVDFARDPRGARRTINDWAAEHVGPAHAQLLGPSWVTALDRLLIVSTLRLDAGWSQALEVDPVPRPFRRGRPSAELLVPMLRGPVRARTRTGAGWRSISLPMTGGLAATIIVPDSDSLIAVERDLAAQRLTTFLPRAPDRVVELRMPTLRLHAHLSLRAAFTALGLESVFTENADLSRMSLEEPVRLSGLRHALDITLDEHGIRTGAPGTTARPPAHGPGSSGRPDEEFAVDRTFVLVVHDERLLTTLLVARVEDPRGDRDPAP